MMALPRSSRARRARDIGRSGDVGLAVERIEFEAVSGFADKLVPGRAFQAALNQAAPIALIGLFPQLEACLVCHVKLRLT